jgi:hypothetical protein
VAVDRRPDLGLSKVLLVEGKTELRALMQFLRLYGKEHEILMIPLHGDEMICGDADYELSELLRIGGNVRYLIDSERNTAGESLKPNRQDFVDLCAKLGISGLVLERRALENYFTDAAVKRAFGESANALAAYEKKGRNQNWPKKSNWRAAAEMRRSDLDVTDLGNFLAMLLCILWSGEQVAPLYKFVAWFVSVPAACPMRWSTNGYGGQSRTTSRTLRPGLMHVSQLAEET